MAINSTWIINDTFLDSRFRYTLFPIFYSIVFVFGLTSNCYTLYILRHIREAKAINEIRIYMTNLTVADLLFVGVLPFWVDYYQRQGNWIFSDVLCRITGSMFFINTYCSVLFLAVITFNRYWVVTRPLEAASADHWRRGVVVSILIWAFSLSSSIFYLKEKGINEDKNMTRCFEGYHHTDENVKRKVAITHFLIIGFFFLVFFLVVVCNLLIAHTLWSRTMPSQPSKASVRRWGVKRRALGMVLVVLVVFVLCFLPHHLVQGPWALAVLRLAWKEDPNTAQWLNDAHQVTLVLMGLNCLLDPVVYCFATRMFRNYISNHLQKVRGQQACPKSMATSCVSLDSRKSPLTIIPEPPLG